MASSKRNLRRLSFEPLEERQLLAVLSVNSLLDNTIAGDGLVTLREAIAAANFDSMTDLGHTGSGADTIQFAPGLSGNVELSIVQDSSALAISSPITIRGNAAGITIARSTAAPEMRLFYVTAAGSLTLESLSLTGGFVRGVSPLPDGGEGRGGAIFNQGTLEIRQSTLFANTAQGGNGVSGGAGGAARGGAIYNDGGAVLLVNATLSANRAQSGTGSSTPVSQGAGIYSRNGTVSVYNSTLASNVANAGHGIYAIGDGAGFMVDLTLHSSIVGNYTSPMGSEVLVAADNGGSAQSRGTHNWIRSAAGFGGSFIPSSDPKLLPLVNNGGPTATHALDVSSLAIDQGANPLALATDGRGAGYARVANGLADVGAFEFQTAAPTLLGDYNRDNAVDAADYVLWRKTLNSHVENYAGADGSGNGEVGVEDRAIWRQHFGAGQASAANTTAADATPLSATTETGAAAPAMPRFRASLTPAISQTWRHIDALQAIDAGEPDDESFELISARPTADHAALPDAQALDDVWGAWPVALDLF